MVARAPDAPDAEDGERTPRERGGWRGGVGQEQQTETDNWENSVWAPGLGSELGNPSCVCSCPHFPDGETEAERSG